jgi:hypothetical protein
LRDILDNLVKEGKKVLPNSFIRTRVNVENLTIEVHGKTDKGWQDLNLKCDIPHDICDNTPTPAVAAVANEVMCLS